MKRFVLCLALVAPLLVGLVAALGQNPPAAPGECTVEFEVNGAIGPATLDLLERAEHMAERKNCRSLLMVLNTPGGNLQTTRLMVERILNSDRPYLCLVAPSGGHAGSAGAILLQACHFSGAFETTNIGAATPVSSTGESVGEDMRKKLVSDTASWVEGLAQLRGRDLKFARDIVVEARSVSAREALTIKAIEWVGTSKEAFLKAAEGRATKLRANENGVIATGTLMPFQHDLRYKVLNFLTNPQIAYLLFMGSLGLLYFELTHPGTIAPGVIGSLGLVISLVALHMLDVAWGGVLLILLGIGLMVAEAFVASFGILGFGGIVAFFVGSIFLFDTSVQGFQLPIASVILPTTVVLGLLMLGVAYLAFSSRRSRRQNMYDLFADQTGQVTQVEEGGREGLVEIAGELWRFQSAQPLVQGDKVRVLRHRGLILEVKKES